MNQYVRSFEFEYSDGGREFSRRPKQKLDCTVRALAIATGAEYDEAYDLLKEYGRYSHRRFPFSTITRTSRLGHVFVWQSFEDDNGRWTMDAATFCEHYKAGIFILQSKGHVFCVKDGVVWDTGPVPDAEPIKGCWRIEKERSARRKKPFTPYVHGSD